MQENLSDATSASAKRALAKVQKMLHAKRNALALRDFREALEECLKTEASTTMKVLGFRLAARCPSCSTMATWQLVLDACVAELASSQNAPVLLVALPLLLQVPLPLVLSFVVATEKEPMNKLRAALTHELADVRSVAIATLSHVTLRIAVSIVTADGLSAFPFESHEARVCCQQDVWTIVTDTWKILFQALFAYDPTALSDATLSSSAAAAATGAAFTAMRMLFARCASVNAFSFVKESLAAQSAVNDVVAAVVKDAYPRIFAVIAAAKKLPLKHQVDAITWIAMLLFLMLDKTGARCPGVSLPYLVLDSARRADGSTTNDDDDDEHSDAAAGAGSSAASCRVRIDQLASDVIATWICPLVGRKASLAQTTALCRAMFLLLSHPLLTFARLQRAPLLANALLAQCFYHRRSDYKLEMSQLLVRVVPWLAAPTCRALFVRIVEALSLMERETDRLGLLQLFLNALVARVVQQREFALLESLCALESFWSPSSASVSANSSSSSSRLSPRTSSAQVFRCLAQALALYDVSGNDDETATGSDERAASVQVAQLIVLRTFQSLLLTKRNTTNKRDQSSLLCYVALLTQHFQRARYAPATLLFRESLAFLATDVQRALRHVMSIDVRVQLLYVTLECATQWPAVAAPTTLLEQLCAVARASCGAASSDDDSDDDASLSSTAHAAFDDGRLGASRSTSTAAMTAHSTNSNVETLAALVNCMHTLAQLAPSLAPAIARECALLHHHVVQSTSASLERVALLELLVFPPNASSSSGNNVTTTKSLFTHELFHPAHLFPPRKYHVAVATDHSRHSLNRVDDSDSVVVTGSSDPLTLRVSYRQPTPGREDVVALVVRCINTTNVTLSDFALHMRVCGALKCVDADRQLTLQMHQSSSAASGVSASGLLPFGVFYAEKRFQLQRFSRATFAFQVAFSELDDSNSGDSGGDGGGEGDSGGTDAPQMRVIRLAPTTPFVLPFTALCRLPKQQAATGACFQRAWQTAEATCQFDVESLASSSSASTSSSSSKTLSFCQQLAKLCCAARVAFVHDVLIDTPLHIHLAYLTETRWDECIAASLVLAKSTSASTQWTGVLELRSTSAVIHVFASAPHDALTAFCGNATLLRLVGASHALMDVEVATAPVGSSSSSSSGMHPTLPATIAPASKPTTTLTDFPSADFTTCASSNKWAASPFDTSDPFSTDQFRPATTTAVTAAAIDHDPWL